MTMTRDDQIRFIGEMCDGIKRDLESAVEQGRVPLEWDGHELRALLKEKFADAADISQIVTSPRSARARDFWSTIRTTNI